MEWPTGLLGAPKIWNLREFFRDCFQNLAQCFIRIQEYFSNVILKKEWPSGPLGAPKVLKFQKFLTDCFQIFGRSSIRIQECFYNIKKYRDRVCPSGSQNLKSPKALYWLLFKICYNVSFEYKSALIKYMEKKWPSGLLEGPKISKHRKFCTDCF